MVYEFATSVPVRFVPRLSPLAYVYWRRLASRVPLGVEVCCHDETFVSSTARLWRLADMSGEADDARLGKTDLKGTIAEVGKWPPILDIRLQC